MIRLHNGINQHFNPGLIAGLIIYAEMFHKVALISMHYSLEDIADQYYLSLGEFMAPQTNPVALNTHR